VLVAGKNGRALLVRGEATIMVAPSTMIALPKDDGEFTTILQQTGEVEFNVDHKKMPHFKVETPWLAALVKGTNFKVRVFDNGAEVLVTRGKVEVDDPLTGQTVFVLPGQKATL